MSGINTKEVQTNLLNHINPTCAVCFSGHRPERLPHENIEMQSLSEVLYQELINAVKQGKNTFLHGCMAGWDIFCAEQVIALKKQYPYIQLISVSPYKEKFFIREKCWSAEWVNRAKEVFKQHDVGVKIAEKYRSGIHYERNRVLVDYSTALICYWDGDKGGTKYTVDYAKNKGLSICNLYK